ncbi:MAG: thioredoxin domain-containing protein [Dehalococcoidia bacterium]
MATSSLHHFSPRPNRAHEIPWLEWGPEVFERARAEDKPVLLGISAVWCHWCHVMDETTYSDQRVIDIVSSRFVPVRVDNDTRPDVNARYNMGGWPTTVFLDPDGEILAGLTYIPPDRMVEMLNRVNEAWYVDRDTIRERLEQVKAQRATREQAAPGALDPQIVRTVLREFEQAYDEQFGGFGNEPKFPQTDAIRLLIRHHLRTNESQPLERARFTLHQMAAGGMYDHVEGGFFRYSTTRDWSVPHFEKMSEDHGGLLLALAELALVAEEEQEVALGIVEPTIAYLDRTLSHRDGGFFGSQDADEEYFALDAAGRAEREAPFVDPRVYASWTAGLARGYLACGVAFERREWIERGRRAIDFLWSRMRAGEAGMYRYWDGEPHLLGMLGDQGATLLALLDAYEVTAEPSYLDHAQQLARITEAHWREPGRGFWDTAGGHDDTGLLSIRTKPLAENADVAEAFMRLGRLTHDERYLRTAEDTLADFAESYRGYGTLAGRYGLAVDRLLSPEAEVQVVAGVEGSEASQRAEALRQRALRLPVATRTVQRLDPARDSSMLYQLALPLDREGVAYVCVGTVCSAPVAHPEDLLGAVEDALAAPAF